MRNAINIGLANWAAPGGAFPIPLQPIPDVGARNRFVYVAGLVLKFDFNITTAVGGGVTAREIMEWISNILCTVLGRNITNVNAHDLCWSWWFETETGSIQFPAAIAANTANALRTVWVVIPFHDPLMEDPRSGEIPAAAFNEGRLQVSMGPALINANTTVNACACAVYAVLDERDNLTIPPMYSIEAADYDFHDSAPAGLYGSAFAVAPAAGWAAANITGLRIQADDGDIYRATTTDGALALHMLLRGLGGPFASANALSWVNNAANMAILPLITPERLGQRGRVVPALGKMLFDIQGAGLATLHIVTKRWESPESISVDMLRAMGAQNPGQILLSPMFRQNTRKLGRTEAPRIPVPLRVVGADSAVSLGALGRAAGLKIGPVSELAASKFKRFSPGDLRAIAAGRAITGAAGQGSGTSQASGGTVPGSSGDFAGWSAG